MQHAVLLEALERRLAVVLVCVSPARGIIAAKRVPQKVHKLLGRGLVRIRSAQGTCGTAGDAPDAVGQPLRVCNFFFSGIMLRARGDLGLPLA